MLIVVAPLNFHFEETVNIFKLLFIEDENFYIYLGLLENLKIIQIFFLLSILSNFYFFIQNFKFVNFSGGEKFLTSRVNLPHQRCHFLFDYLALHPRAEFQEHGGKMIKWMWKISLPQAVKITTEPGCFPSSVYFWEMV